MARLAMASFSFLCLSGIILFTGCKSQKSTQVTVERQILLLLEEGFSPDDITILDFEKVVSSKRTSRSQNLWLLKIMLDDKNFESLLHDLKVSDGVVNVQSGNSSETVNFNNSNKKESSPKK